MANGRDTLDRIAPEASAALRSLEAAAWAEVTTAGLLDLFDLVRRVCAAQHGLAPLEAPPADRPGRWADQPAESWRTIADLSPADRSALRFAEQFGLDVSALRGADRAALVAGFSDRVGTVVPVIYVMDYLPRIRAALDALFGISPPLVPAPWPDVPGIWAAIDGIIRAVPRLDSLDPVTTELVRLRGARQHQCRICSSLRSRSALVAGADDGVFAALDHYQDSSLTPSQKAALAFTDAMVWTPGRIEAAVVADLHATSTEAQCVELVLDVARNSLNKIAVALGADAPHVTEGVEIFDVDANGDLIYGVSLEDVPGPVPFVTG
jgi:alkylhydroperoxidase family enzyme